MKNKVDGYYVYRYEHLDDLSFIRKRDDIDPMIKLPAEDEIAVLFRRHGWEGDGEIGLLWLPPFVGVGTQDTWGVYVWVVKQANNGTAFLASEFELNFQRLNEQNRERAVWRGLYPEGVGRVSLEAFEEELEAIVAGLAKDTAQLASLAEGSRIIAELSERAQGRIIQCLNELLDDCYFRVLHDVICDGNRSGLKLRKTGVNLAPADYFPESAEADMGAFFTLNGLVADMWAAFKFEPFPQKLEMLLNPIELKLDGELMASIRKHVMLRNVVQHHAGRLSERHIKDLGVKRVELASTKGNVVLGPGDLVAVPQREIEVFCNHLSRFARSLEKQMEVRIVSRVYSKR